MVGASLRWAMTSPSPAHFASRRRRRRCAVAVGEQYLVQVLGAREQLAGGGGEVRLVVVRS
jgi:hypothetical protein